MFDLVSKPKSLIISCSETHFSDRWMGTGDEFLLRLSRSKCFSLTPFNPLTGTFEWEFWCEYSMASLCSLRIRFLNVYLRVEGPPGDNGILLFRYFRRSLSSVKEMKSIIRIWNFVELIIYSLLTKPPSTSFSFFVYFLLPVRTSMLYFLTFFSSPSTFRVVKIVFCSSLRLTFPLDNISISRVTCFIMVFGDDFNIFDCHSGIFMIASKWMLLDTSKIPKNNMLQSKLFQMRNSSAILPSGKLRTGWNPGSKSATRSAVARVSGKSRGAVGSCRPVHSAHGWSGQWHPHLMVLRDNNEHFC